jgi:predicted DCC family thiol-disulfide oxidoreductase YuxK
MPGGREDEMSGGWSGGQYSVFRVLLGLWLAARFASLALHAAGIFPPGLLLMVLGGIAAGVFLALGVWHRAAAFGLALAWALLFERTPWIPSIDLVVVECLLVAHLLLPPAPYGSLAARGRADPAGAWRMPAAPYIITAGIAAAALAGEGYALLAAGSDLLAGTFLLPAGMPLGPAGLLAARLGPAAGTASLRVLQAAALGQIALVLLIPVRRLRPWLWLLLASTHLLALFLVDGFRPVLLLLDLFLLDPAWVSPVGGGAPETIFYDGGCGLCHRFVRFLLAEDPDGRAFRFAPLQGAAFHAAVPEARRAALPDSIVLRAGNGALLVRSSAVVHALDRLGGLWRLGGRLAVLLPRRLRDGAYDLVAKLRHRLFRRPEASCPLVPESLRRRFDE